MNIFSNAKKQGYDLFNPDDPFYSKICTRYTSESGTDVLLDDRISFYFNTVVNFTTCPDNCQFISYSTETQNLKCECGIIDEDISTLDLNHINSKNTYKSFYSALKYSNYKVMICYNLVFNFKIFCQNIGSILTLILFIFYLCILVLYVCKDSTSLKSSISKVAFPKAFINLKEKKNDIGFPPKKKKNRKSSLEIFNYKKNNDNTDLIKSSNSKKIIEIKKIIQLKRVNQNLIKLQIKV